MKEIYAARIIDMPQAMARLKRVAEELGLPLGERKKTYNSRLATGIGQVGGDQREGG